MKTLTAIATASVVAAVAVTATAFAPAPAEANNTFYTVACLHNQTKYTIRFQDSQNGGPFTPSVLAPGQTMTYSLRYKRANDNTAMRVIVSYDADGSAGRFNRRIRLRGYASTGQTCREGKQYAFRPEPRDGRMIMIQEID